MAYSSFIQSLPETLRQPSSIAVLASILLHGLVGATFSFQPTEPDFGQGVKVVELSPTEQTRLPQAVTPQVPLPSSAQPNQTNLLPTLPPAQSSNLVPLPNNNQPLYTVPFSPPPPMPWYWNPPKLPAPNSSVVRAPNQPIIRPPAKTPQPPSSGFSSGSRPVKITELDQLVSVTPVSPTPPTAPNQQTSPTPQSSPSSPSPPVSSSQTSPPQSSPSPSSTTNRPDKISPAAIQQLRQLQQQKRELYAYNGTGTTPEEATENLQSWLAKVNRTTWDQKLEISATSNLEKLKGAVSVAVAVDPAGKIINGPEIVQSSGYQVLNRTALDKVKQYDFEPTGKEQVYLIRVQFTDSTNSAVSGARSPLS